MDVVELEVVEVVDEVEVRLLVEEVGDVVGELVLVVKDEVEVGGIVGEEVDVVVGDVMLVVEDRVAM